jgi:hypothetical protein
MHKSKVALAALLSTAALASCEPGATTTEGSNFEGYGLTSESFKNAQGEGTDTINMTGDDVFAVATSPKSNQGSNTRTVFVTKSSQTAADQELCTTWLGKTDPNVQPGVMLRWDGSEGISFTQNIVYGVYNTINAHVWNTNKPVGGPQGNSRFEMIGQFQLSELNDKSFPWRFCARVAGPVLQFKVWPTNEYEPGYSHDLQTDVMHMGQTGIYVGHVKAGHAAAFSDTTTGTL